MRILLTCILALSFLFSSCNKNYRAIKKISGDWEVTKITRDGVEEDMNILKIELSSNYDVGDSWFGYYEENNVNSAGSPTYKKLDLHIQVVSKGKKVEFIYDYGSYYAVTEYFDVIKLKKNFMKLKAVGEESYYEFNR